MNKISKLLIITLAALGSLSFCINSTMASSLGGTFWIDGDGDAALDGGENRISGVEIHLYLAFPDPYAAPTKTTTTNTNGFYSFSDLSDGSYFVFVDSEEFNSGEALYGYSILPGGENTSPDDDVDHDNNGINHTSGGIYSYLALTLNGETHDEVLSDNYNDYNANYTLDFGFEESQLNPVPLPPAILLFGVGLLGFAGVRKKKLI